MDNSYSMAHVFEYVKVTVTVINRPLYQPTQYRTLALHAHHQSCTSALTVHDIQDVQRIL